jgi:heavy metal efflux system protein
MIQKIINWSIQNKIIVGALIIAWIGWGIVSLKKLPLDAIPDVTSNQVNVVTVAPNLAPVEMEQFVTYPIEMALTNIQGVNEIRSTSQFGLSLITLEFKENIDLYWARNQVNERLQQVREDIPKGFGTPQMLPVTTGLGEVFQYKIEPVNPNDTSWSLMQLRDIQDWTVRRQLLGTEGVAEVSGFGGFMKQYQVKVNPDRLKALDLTLQNVFDALEKGNANTGAAYIERYGQSYFIRGVGLATSKKDLENTFIKSNGGLSVSVSEVATIEEGNAIRYGGLIDHKSEIVGGIVLMLKGENSRQVVLNVKERLKSIEKNLPKGLKITPFIDREDLINHTIKTVFINLLEGGAIVILVLFVLLGHFRAGLIIASVIPLSMLFAVGCMVAFGVSGNLMSLGAIDFGLIVDGAVIIVENVIHHLQKKQLAVSFEQSALSIKPDSQNPKPETQNPKPENTEGVVQKAASEIMRSAVFGSFIIMIVYVPLLLLQNIEGKMFKPMALTVLFALAGALILSLTYVPVVCDLFLKNASNQQAKFSDSIMSFLTKIYQKALKAAMNVKKTVIFIGFSLLIIAFFIFQKMGSEFIPQLDEGDFAVEVTMMPGTSLSQMVVMGNAVAKKLLAEFPNEIKITTGKIGTSEIPTDPMSIEEMDLILTMYPKDLWKKCTSRSDFETQLNAVLGEIPGVNTSIQQPIAMRFNELMTGAKTDVIVKVLGNDLDQLADIANKIEAKIKPIEGIADLYVAKAEGMPQLFITYKRPALMQYGVTVEDVGRTLRMAIAGEKAGVIYEENRRYDIVVKLKNASSQNLTEIGEVMILTENGTQIPLKMLADIEIKNAPMAVFRENAERCVNVNLNVRGRDVASVVTDIKNTVENQIKVPTGYHITYGGQFENLENARNRLLLVVPAALLLILLLLYLSFQNMKESLLIFSAIPFAAVGGVFALALRGMPFSISAGVGFIALFGVAVLNGLVLIGHFNLLEKEHRKKVSDEVYNQTLLSFKNRIAFEGALDRFRPVIMTATVASLGFLPMAIANGAGAEVQKPLATVVIGGLITSTLLTLILLPVLYTFIIDKIKIPSKTLIVLFIIASKSLVFSQNTEGVVTLNSEKEAIDLALKNNALLSKNQTQIEQARLLIPTAKTIMPTDFFVETPQLYMAPDQSPIWSTIGAQQTFKPRKVYRQNEKVLQQNVKVTESERAIFAHDIAHQTRTLYQNCLYAKAKMQFLQRQDSVFSEFNRVAEVESRAGKITPLEKLTLQSFYQNFAQILRGSLVDNQNALNALSVYLKSPQVVVNQSFTKLDTLLFLQKINLPIQDFQRQNMALQTEKIAQQKLATSPQYLVSVSQFIFNQWIPPVIRGGISIPLWKKSYTASNDAAALDYVLAQKELEQTEFELQITYQNALNDMRKAAQNLNFYEKIALPQADEILKMSMKTRQLGDITASQYLQNMRQVFDIQLNYWEALKTYNESVLKTHYFTKN